MSTDCRSNFPAPQWGVSFAELCTIEAQSAGGWIGILNFHIFNPNREQHEDKNPKNSFLGFLSSA